jgi:hypothetical protein
MSDQQETLELARQEMIKARSALMTALGEVPDDLIKPERARVIARRISGLTSAISNADDVLCNKTVTR